MGNSGAIVYDKNRITECSTGKKKTGVEGVPDVKLFAVSAFFFGGGVIRVLNTGDLLISTVETACRKDVLTHCCT